MESASEREENTVQGLVEKNLPAYVVQSKYFRGFVV